MNSKYATAKIMGNKIGFSKMAEKLILEKTYKFSIIKKSFYLAIKR